MSSLRAIRAVGAVIALAVVVLLVNNWWDDYRSAQDVRRGGEATSTVEPEPEAKPEGGDEAKPDEGAGTGTDAPATADDTPVTGKKVVVVVDGLNFRVSPERDSKLIRGLAAGSELEFLAEENGWYKVKDGAGVVGYVSASSQYSRLED
jgi:uncharacterized protein YgiM (DUF1202 family)